MNNTHTIVAFTLAATLWSSPLGAQTPPIAQTPSETAPAPIPAAEVPQRAEQDILSLQEMATRWQTIPELGSIESELDGLLAAQRQFEPVAELHTLQELTDVKGLWAGHLSRINGWQQTLQASSEALQAELDTLRRIRLTWETTRRSATDQSRVVAERVESVLDTVRKVEHELSGRMDRILRIQNRLAEQAIDISRRVAELDAAIETALSDLFREDSRPLWLAFRLGERTVGPAEEVTRRSRIHLEELRAFFSEHRDRVWFQLAFFVTLSALFRQFRRRTAKDVAEDEGMEATSHVLARPFSAALLITLIAGRVFYPAAPFVVFEIHRLIALIPLLRILPRLMPKDLRTPLYAAGALYVLVGLTRSLSVQTLMGRLLLLAVTALAMGGLAWFHRFQKDDAPPGAWRRAAQKISILGLLVLAASALGNVLGMVRLADLLTTAVLNSVFTALAFFAAVVTLQASLALLLRTRALGSLHVVDAHRDSIQSRGNRFIRFVAFVSWSVGALSFFHVLDVVVRGLRAALGASLSVGTLHVSLGNVLALVLAVWLSFKVSALIRFILEEDLLPRFDLPRGVPGAVSALTGYAVLFVGFLLALAAAGIEMSRFAILAGAFGVGIGFGLQNVVNNFVSGLILLFERPIQVGDLVELDQLLGKVERIGIRSSTVRTFDGAEVILPNATLIDSRVTNWTLSDQLRRFDVAVGVAYGTDPAKVLDILQTVAKNSPDVLESPEPLILFLGFGESSLDFSLRAWTYSDGFLAVKSRVTVALYAALNEAGIEIPFAQRDLHLRSVDDSVLGSMRLKSPSDESAS